MDFSRSDDHEAIRDGIRRICADFADEYWAAKDEAHEFPWEFYEQLAAGGWVGIAIPEEYGGGGQGITEASVMLEEIAASGAAMNGCSAIHLSIFGMEPVRRHGSPELAAEVLPRVASGELHVAFGVTEPDAGTDTTSIRTRAVRDGDEYVVHGAKVWTTKAPLCEMCLLLVRTTPREECAKPTDGMTLLLVDLQRPEVDIRPIPKLGRNAVVSCEVRYDGLRVPGEPTRRRGGQGLHVPARRPQPRADPDRLPRRSASGGPRCGRRSTTPTSGWCSAVRSARTRASRSRSPRRTCVCTPPSSRSARRRGCSTRACRAARRPTPAKYLAAEAAFFACDRAMQTHGGMGYAQEYHVERYWREARLMQIAPGQPGDGVQLHRRERARPPEVVLTDRRSAPVRGGQPA